MASCGAMSDRRLHSCNRVVSAALGALERSLLDEHPTRPSSTAVFAMVCAPLLCIYSVD